MSDDSAKQTPDILENPAPAEKKPKSRSRPVTTYLLILFLAALLLLLLSFFMQQRNHQALLDLNNSVTARQNITELQMANQQLEFRLEEAQHQVNDLTKEKDTLTARAEEAQKEAEALEWLRQIEAATRTSYSRSQELVKQFQATGLERYLPVESIVEGGTSPAETYRNIYAMLF